MPFLSTAFQSPADVVLLVLLVIAAVTDARSHRIYNWTTYPGMLAGFALNYFWRGWPGLEDSGKGFLLCGVLMLVCFVLFSIGGGDVKLVAMMGACLGVERGIESMLWTFIIGGVFGVGYLVWKHGLVNIITGTLKHLRLVLKAGTWVPLTKDEREPLKRWLFLAPSGLAAVCLVLADHHWNFFTR